MNFLKTFFGQIIRRSDIDFQNEGVRQSNVQTHIDYTGGLGGVVSGLDVFKTSDGLEIIVTPGVFYTKGQFASKNSFGGGERCQVYSSVRIAGLPVTSPLNGQPRYVLVYAKTIDSNIDPNYRSSQAIVTSQNIQTGERVPSREYTTAIIAITNPIFISEVGNLSNTLPLALVQVDYVGLTRVSSDGSIQAVDPSPRTDYTIAGIINIPKKKLNTLGIANDFLQSRMIGDQQVVGRNIPDGLIDSIKLAPWDGLSSGTTSGSGVTTGHIKTQAITYPKINITGSLNNYSATNYVFNSSFDIIKNTPSEPDLVGWQIYNEATGISTYTGPAAGVFQTNAQAYNGIYSAVINGVDPVIASGAKGVALYQDIMFPDYDINDKPVMSFFYMKTDADMPISISGVSGISASLQFLSNGSGIGSPTTFASYSGAMIDWTKFETSEPIIYRDKATVSADGVRLLVSGNTTNSINIYLDNVFAGVTDIEPSWSASAADESYSSTLNKRNVTSTNLTVTNLNTTNLTVTSLQSVGSGVAALGTVVDPFEQVYSNEFYLGGEPLSINSNRSQVFGTAAAGVTATWTVPSNTTTIMVDMLGGGGGGAAGTDDSSVYIWPAAECSRGGAGGSSAEYVRQTLSVTPGEILTIMAGGGGAGGTGGIFYDPAASYLGLAGQPSLIKRGAISGLGGTVVATAAAGLGGGSTLPGGVRNPNPGGGTTAFSNEFISIKGQTTISGSIPGAGPFQVGTVSNCGGPGASLIAGPFKTNGGLGGGGYDAGQAHPFNPAQLGKTGGPGAGGGGGGGSASSQAGPPPLDSRGGSGGTGGAGIVIIYY